MNEGGNRHIGARRFCLDGDLGACQGTAVRDGAFHGYDRQTRKNLDGKNVGKIKDLVISWRSDGYIEYAVLSTDGFWGLEDEYSIAVPWGALTPSDNKEHFVLNVKEEHLKDAPGFTVYRFYDRSSAVAYRGDRSPVVSSAPMMRGDIKSDVTVSVARSFDMPHVMAAEVHRR